MTNFAALEILGLDAQSYLQRQLSNDVSELKGNGDGIYGALLKANGEIVSLGYLVLGHSKAGVCDSQMQRYYFITLESQSTKAFEHLCKFAITEDVVFKLNDSLLAYAKEANLVIEEVNSGDNLIKLDLISKYVSFTKGCFPGQEVLAKYKNIGLRKKEERSKRYLDEALSLNAHASDSAVNTTAQPPSSVAPSTTQSPSDLELAQESAIELLRKSIKEDPRNEEAYEALGVLLARQKKYPEAIKVMQQLELLNPKSIMAKANLSILYMKIGDKETAEQYKAEGTVLQFEQALKS